MQQKNQEKVWDAIAWQWYHFRHQQFKDVAIELEKLAKLKKSKILEIGCGNCRNLKTFAQQGFDCYGIDFSKEMIKYAKEYCKKHNFKVKLKKAKAEKLPFKDKSFDYILNIATLHHLKPNEQEKSIKEMWRVLNSRGLAFISVWNIKDKNKKLKENIKEKYISWKVKGRTYWRYYYVFTLAELKELLKRNGFSIIRQKTGKNIIMLVRKA